MSKESLVGGVPAKFWSILNRKLGPNVGRFGCAFALILAPHYLFAAGPEEPSVCDVIANFRPTSTLDCAPGKVCTKGHYNLGHLPIGGTAEGGSSIPRLTLTGVSALVVFEPGSDSVSQESRARITEIISKIVEVSPSSMISVDSYPEAILIDNDVRNLAKRRLDTVVQIVLSAGARPELVNASIHPEPRLRCNGSLPHSASGVELSIRLEIFGVPAKDMNLRLDK